jgi:DNA-binding NtrC family response regulator
MKVSITGRTQISLSEVATALRREGVHVGTVVPSENLGQTDGLSDAQYVILIMTDPGIVTIGEEVTRVRGLIDSEVQLILCIPQLQIKDRQLLLKEGVSSIITPKTWAAEHIAERVLAQLIVWDNIRPSSYGEMRGATAAMRALYAEIERVAPLSEPILILGPTGTGKELVAKSIHDHSNRSGGYVKVNCPEISPELMSSELFGHERGAFTGAEKSRIGLIASAGKGTVFLDEIGELDLQAQAKILRVLEYREVRRVGANNWDEVESRVVMATNRNLEELCAQGKFRRDLFERIQGFTLRLPPLREKRGDILLLVNHFLEKYNEEYKTSLTLPEGAAECLFCYDWPGNIRELRGVVRKAAAYADGPRYINHLILQEGTRARPVEASLHAITFDPSVDTWKDLVNRARGIYFQALLAETNGNREAAAKLSGLSRSQFFEKLKPLQKDQQPDAEE